jgi:hypothetical protein
MMHPAGSLLFSGFNHALHFNLSVGVCYVGAASSRDYSIDHKTAYFRGWKLFPRKIDYI